MKNKPKFNNLPGLDDRRLLTHVGRFGEFLAAILIGGTVVSDDQGLGDVSDEGCGIVAEVKMCNGRHAARILPKQILTLHENVTNTPFLYNTGVYLILFYGGINKKRGYAGKSFLWSRRLSEVNRRIVLAQQMQRIYVMDVPLLNHLALHCPTFFREGCLIASEGKDRPGAIYLNRQRLRLFFENSSKERRILTDLHGTHGWSTSTTQVEFNFQLGTDAFQRTLPVHYIGSRRTWKVVKPLLQGNPRAFQLDFNAALFQN